MTEAQLELVTHTAENAVRKFEHRRTRASRVGYGVLAAGVILAFVANSHDTSGARHAIVESGRAVSVAGCNRDFQSTKGLRATFRRLDTANHAAFRAHKITLEQRDEAHAFYTEQIRLTPLPDCLDALHVVTANPSAKIAIPVPLRPPGAEKKG